MTIIGRSPYREQIISAADTHGLDPLLVESVVLQESSGCADAFRFEKGFWLRYLQGNPEYANEEPRRVSSSYGLMQVMFSTARDLGYKGTPEGLFDIPTNLDLGCKLLASLIKRFNGDVRVALAAYNGGPGNVNADAPRRYAELVLKIYDRLVAR